MYKLKPFSEDKFEVKALAAIASELGKTDVVTVADDFCFAAPSWWLYWSELFSGIQESAAPVIDDEGAIRCLPNDRRQIRNLFLISKTISFRYHHFAILLAEYKLAEQRITDGEAYVGEELMPPAYAAYAAALDQDGRARALTEEETTTLRDMLYGERITYQILFENDKATLERHIIFLRPETGPKGRWAERLITMSSQDAHRGRFGNIKRSKIEYDDEKFPEFIDHFVAEIASSQPTDASTREILISLADVRQAVERNSETIASNEEAAELLRPFITRNGKIAISAATRHCSDKLMNRFFTLQTNAFGIPGLVIIEAEYSRFEKMNKISEYRTYFGKYSGGIKPLGDAERERLLKEIAGYIESVDLIYQLYDELRDLA